jgi:hypothetical protein
VNKELRDLLIRGGYESAARPGFRWHQVIVHRNIASVPPARHVAGEAVWNHGFNLILLDEKGVPTHYAKCRPASVSGTMHEATVLAAFATDPGLADIIPPTRSVSSATLTVQVSRFIGDRPWDADSIRGNVGAWTRAVREILAIVRRLAERAAVLLPAQNCQRIAHPGEAVRPLLAALTPIGVDNEALEVLLAAADSAPTVDARPQHGDLWPANLVERPEGGWWLLDFEMYGRIWMPFHDVFHLVRTSASLDDGGTWLQQLAVGDEWARAQQRIIREAAVDSALPASALSVLAIYYFAEMTERLYRSGTPQSFWQPYLSEIHDAVDHLKKFGTLEDLLVGSPSGANSSTSDQPRSALRPGDGLNPPRRK